MDLLIFETHPVQYHAPVYRKLAISHGLKVGIVYASDDGVRPYKDNEFDQELSWDVPLLFPETPATFLVASTATIKAYPWCTLGSSIFGALRKARPRAVLIVGYANRFYLTALIAARIYGCKVLMRAETTDHAVQRSTLKSAIRDITLKVIYSQLSGVLPIGTRSQTHFQRLGISAWKMILAPYCVNESVFKADESARLELREPTRRQIGLEPNKICVLFSGKLSPRKGVHVLVEAVKQLPAANRSQISLLFLGEGASRGSLSTSSAQDPQVQLRFTGFKNQTQLSPFYQAADLLVLPSISGETWGLVVNEALLHGLPCVVTDAVGCAPDLVEPQSTGEHASAGDSASLANAILRASALVGCPMVRAKCRDRAAKFSTAAAANGIAASVRKLLAPRSAS